MDLLKMLKKNSNFAKNYCESKNYYFENHFCEKLNNNKKIELDFEFYHEKSGKAIKFGICDDCKTMFYYYDNVYKSF